MKRRIITIASIIVAVGILLIFFGNSGLINPLSDFVTIILKPLQKIAFFGSGSVESYFSKRESIDELNDRIKSLEESISNYEKENTNLKILLDELKISRAEKEFLTERGLNYVSAMVVGHTTDTFMEEVIINIGSDDGIKVGYAVVAENGYLAGKINQVWENASKVLLIVDDNCEVAGQILNDSNAPGLIKGKLGLSVTMELIPQNEIIQTDQMVITSGIEMNIPKGIIIGKLGNVNIDPGDIFQQATIITAVDFNKLGIVSVIIPEININD